MKKLIVTAALLLVANLGIAQTQEFKNDVKRMITISGAAGSSQIEMAKKQVMPMIAADKQEAFSKEFDALLTGFMTEIEKFYLTEFTHDDIKQILKFYDSPVGKKMTQKATALSERIAPQTQELGGKVQELVMKYMQ